MARLLCACFPHLGLLATWHRHPELRSEPVVVGGSPELRLPVLAAAAPAVAAGVRVGQTLREAQQRCPAAVFVNLDQDVVDRLRTSVLAALLEVVPGVEVGDDEAFASLDGSHAMHRGEAGWASALGRSLAWVLGEPPSLGVANSRFAARMAARAAAPGRMRLVPAGEEAAFVARLPIGLLPLSPPLLQRLHALGLDSLGAVAALSPADLQRQFGREGLDAHALARGQGCASITAWRPPRALAERVVLDGPVSDLEVLRFAARRCCGQLGEQLQAQALAAGSLGLGVELEGEPALSVTRPLPGPAGNAGELWPGLLGMLGSLRIIAPVVALRLEAAALVAGGGRQVDLLRTGDGDREAVARTVMRLCDRFGPASVRRPALAGDPGDLPERRFTWRAPVAPVGPVSTAPPTRPSRREPTRAQVPALPALPVVKR